MSMEKHKTQFREDVLLEEVELKELVLFNDDVNTFEHVISTLVKVCNHEPEQAEQCAYIVHYKGKCTVKYDAYEKLIPYCEALLERQLTAKII